MSLRRSNTPSMRGFPCFVSLFLLVLQPTLPTVIESALAAAAAVPLPPRPRISTEEEIAELVQQLEAASVRDRAAAYARLRDIGPSVIEVLRKMHYGNSTDSRCRALELVNEIRRENGIRPVDEKSLEFFTVTDLVWLMPPPGQTCDIKLEVKIINCGERAVHFNHFDAFGIGLVGSDGRPIACNYYRDHVIGKNYLSPLIPKGEILMCSDFAAKVHRSADGQKLDLECSDGCGGVFSFKSMTPGKVGITIRAAHDGDGAASQVVIPDGTRMWQGNVNLPPVIIQIK